jgi:hypothetical protein
MGRACSSHEYLQNAHKVFAGKPEGKRPLKIICRKWEDNVKIHIS